MRTIRLHAVSEDDQWNSRSTWRFRTQILGSILLWGHRANADRIEHNVHNDEPFVYYSPDNSLVESEFPQPPENLRPGIRQHLFIDTIDGHPVLRPLRRLVRFLQRRPPQAKFLVPDCANQVESIWLMTIDDETTHFQLTGKRRMRELM